MRDHITERVKPYVRGTNPVRWAVDNYFFEMIEWFVIGVVILMFLGVLTPKGMDLRSDDVAPPKSVCIDGNAYAVYGGRMVQTMTDNGPLKCGPQGGTK